MEFLKNHHVVAGMTESNDPRCNITGGQEGDRISLKGYNRIGFLIIVDAWAGGDSAITLKQATSVANTDSAEKALTYAGYWTSANYAAEATPAWVKTATGTLTIANADSPDNKAYFIEVEADSLDADNGFDCVRIDFATPGANANYLNCVAILSDPRHGGDESMVNPVTD